MQVSVIIPVFNAAPFLDKSIQSALDQKQTREVILIDDRSTDNSLEICKKWELLDSRVKVFVNEGIKGAGDARNVGLRHASCEYIAFLDADDYYLEGRFEETEKLFKNIFSIDGVSESAIVFFNHEKNAKVISGNYKKKEIIGYKENYTKIYVKNFLKNSNVMIQGITIKRQIIGNNFYFDPFLKQTQDTDFMIKLFSSYNLISGIFFRPVVAYNFHANNTTKNFYESAYYRHILYKKHLKLCLTNYHPKSLLIYFFIRYVEYAYIIKVNKSFLPKKITKLILLPIFIYWLFSKNDNRYDTNRSIPPI